MPFSRWLSGMPADRAGTILLRSKTAGQCRVSDALRLRRLKTFKLHHELKEHTNSAALFVKNWQVLSSGLG
jgi:hypothetical protein